LGGLSPSKPLVATGVQFSKQDCSLDLTIPSNADICFNAKHNSVDWQPRCSSSLSW